MLTSRGTARPLLLPAAHVVKAPSPTEILRIARSQLRTRMFAAIEAVQRLFADFADIPYEDSASQRQWEELLESLAERWRYE